MFAATRAYEAVADARGRGDEAATGAARGTSAAAQHAPYRRVIVALPRVGHRRCVFRGEV